MQCNTDSKGESCNVIVCKDLHVLNGATEGVSGSVSIEGLLAESKVREHHMTLPIQHNVLRLQISAGKGNSYHRTGLEGLSHCTQGRGWRGLAITLYAGKGLEGANRNAITLYAGKDQERVRGANRKGRVIRGIGGLIGREGPEEGQKNADPHPHPLGSCDMLGLIETLTIQFNWSNHSLTAVKVVYSSLY
jgi:hypothetical protein